MTDSHLGFCVQHNVHEINHTGASDKVVPSFHMYSYV